jgi:hypothetical protein
MQIPYLTPGQGLLTGLLVSAAGWAVCYFAWLIPYVIPAYIVSAIGCVTGLASAIRARTSVTTHCLSRRRNRRDQKNGPVSGGETGPFRSKRGWGAEGACFVQPWNWGAAGPGTSLVTNL